MDLIFLSTVLKISIKCFSRWGLLGYLIFATSNGFAAQQAVIISSANNNHHKELIENIQSNLKTSNINVETFDIGESIKLKNNRDLIIALGHKTADLIEQKKLSNPKLRIFTHSNQTNESEHGGKSHLSMTQPVCQQFALARLLNPEWKLVSVLSSTKKPKLLQTLSSCAKQYKFKLNSIAVDQYINIIDALNTSLPGSDVLIALPDPAIYNAKTIKSILLTTYRHRVPIIGFSENFVRAGALAAIHSSTKQLGKQIAELIQQHYNNKNIDKHLYPAYFDVITNKNVAKSLGINIPDMKSLTKQLRQTYNE